LTFLANCATLKPSKSKTKTYINNLKDNALRNPKGSKSGQSKPKGSKRYINNFLRADLLPAALAMKKYCGANIRSIFSFYVSAVE